MNRQPIIKLEHVSAGYEHKQVLDDVSLTVYDHDFLGIIGPNGGGKTTLVRTMLGLMKPQKGTVSYFRNGAPVEKLAIGYLPQYSQIDRKFPISVSEVVLSGLSQQKSLLQRYKPQHHQAVADILRRLEISDLAGRPIGQLSGGQLQRVLLGRAIVANPEVIVLDEPNTYIDQRFQEQMYKLLTSLHHDSAVVIVSHDIGTVMQNVQNIACVNHTLHYHAADDVDEHELEHYFGCPLELVGHGDIPHRVLKHHHE